MVNKRTFFKILSSTLAIATRYVAFVKPICVEENKAKITGINKREEIVIGLDEKSLKEAEVRLVVSSKPFDEVAKIVIDYCYNLTIQRINREACIDFEFDKCVELNVEIRCVVEGLSLLVSCLWEDVDYIDFTDNTGVACIWWADGSMTDLDLKGMNSLDAFYKVFSFCYNEQAVYEFLK